MSYINKWGFGVPVVKTSDPAIGAELTFTVTTGKFWLPIACRYRLVTSATAGSRRPVLQIEDDAANIVWKDQMTNTISVSATEDFGWALGMGYEHLGSDDANESSLPFILMGSGWKIRSTQFGGMDTNGSTGDNIGLGVLYIIEYDLNPV